MSIEQIREAALALPPEARLDLADQLYSSVAAGSKAQQLSPAFIAELNRRSDELESGQALGIAWEQVQDEWKSAR